MTSENLNMTNISKGLLNKSIWAQGWYLVAAVVNPFCGFNSFCIFSGLSVFAMTSPVEVWNEWSWRHESTFLPPGILMLGCGAPAEQVRWGSPVPSPSPPQAMWPLAQLSHRYTNRSPFTYLCCLWAKAGEKTTGKVNMGIKGNFCTSQWASHTLSSIHHRILLPLVW